MPHSREASSFASQGMLNTEYMCVPLQYMCVPLQHMCVPLQYMCVPLQHMCVPLQYMCVPLQYMCVLWYVWAPSMVHVDVCSSIYPCKGYTYAYDCTGDKQPSYRV